MLRWNGTEAEVVDVYRVGDDQALRIRGAAPESGVRVEAEVGRRDRHATMRNHTATHLLHAALRERLGTHVRQAGSAVRPDKLRFDFTHGARLGPEELAAVEDASTSGSRRARPSARSRWSVPRPSALGAMALFGEKYGDWVRMVEVEDVSRELCGGTHVANTAEVGIFEILSEGSSASNVRRIEAITGPAAIDAFRRRSEQLDRIGRGAWGRATIRPAPPSGRPPGCASSRPRRPSAAAAAAGDRAAELVGAAETVGGIQVVVGSLGEGIDAKRSWGLPHNVLQGLGESGAVVLGCTVGEKVVARRRLQPGRG